MMRVYKHKQNFLRYFNEKFNLRAGYERFVIFVIVTLMIYHLVACIW